MKIKEICEYGKKSKIKAGEGLSKGNVKFFTSSSESNKFVKKEQFTNPGIIMGTGGNATLHYCDEPFSVSTDCIVLFPKIKVSPKYLYYFFKGNFHVLQSGFKGAGLKHTSKKYIDEISLNHIPSNDEQVQIVNILDNVNDIIVKKNQQLQEYDQLIKSRFVEMFNSSFRDKKCYRSIDEICNLIDYRGKTPEKSDSGIPLITAKNVKSNKFDIEPREYIPAENYNSVMTRGYPKINDVLFTTEAPLGNVCRIPDVYDKFCVGQRLITMQPKKDILTSEYLEMALLSEEFQEEMWRRLSGSTVKGIRSKLLVKIQVSVPDYGSQIQFSRIVQQVDKLKFVVQQSLDETQKLFDSLMQKYFG